MAISKPIFDLRFGSNEELSPTREELEVFLRSPKVEGRRESHGNDIAAYRKLLEAIKAFEQHKGQYSEPQSFRDTMFYGVLGQSRFFSPVLASEATQYKYHLHALLTLDFNKPKAFIKAARDEMGRFNPRKKEDAVKLARFRAMVEERRKTLAILEKRRESLVRELGDIALYIRDNLVMIAKRCETSIVVLVELQISRKKEKQLVEDIRMRFKEHLKDSLRGGPAAGQDVETFKRDIAQLSKEISNMLREDVYALTRLYEAVLDHVQKTAREMETLLAKIERGRDKTFEDDRKLFTEIGNGLVSLISGWRFELQPAIIRSETAHGNILLEKREELLDYVFELLNKERRSWLDRRSAENRRRITGMNSTSSERRKGKDRRSGKRRR